RRGDEDALATHRVVVAEVVARRSVARSQDLRLIPGIAVELEYVRLGHAGALLAAPPGSADDRDRALDRDALSEAGGLIRRPDLQKEVEAPGGRIPAIEVSAPRLRAARSADEDPVSTHRRRLAEAAARAASVELLELGLTSESSRRERDDERQRTNFD